MENAKSFVMHSKKSLYNVAFLLSYCNIDKLGHFKFPTMLH